MILPCAIPIFLQFLRDSRVICSREASSAASISTAALATTLINNPLDYRLVGYRKDAMHDAVIGRQGRRCLGCACGQRDRHRPEQTLLYQLVEAHYPAFVAHLAACERSLPAHVQREFEDYLKCGRLEHGFLRVRCGDAGQARPA